MNCHLDATFYRSLMLGPSLFLLDELVDKPWHGATTDTSGGLRLGPIGIAHETEVKRLFGSDIAVIVKSELAALAALEVFSHDLFL